MSGSPTKKKSEQLSSQLRAPADTPRWIPESKPRSKQLPSKTRQVSFTGLRQFLPVAGPVRSVHCDQSGAKGKSPADSEQPSTLASHLHGENSGKQGGSIQRELGEELRRRADRSVDRRELVKYFLKQFRKSWGSYVKQGKLRPDLDAQKELKEFREFVNGTNAIYGEVPGVEVGDTYDYLAEAFLISLHRKPRGGIDFITDSTGRCRDNDGNPLSVAVSVVLYPGGKNAVLDNGDKIWYKGEGGHDPPNHQQMVNGNLALKNSFHRGLSVRVIRGRKVKKTDESPSGIIYSYEGLYRVKACRKRKVPGIHDVYRFKLVRGPWL